MAYGLAPVGQAPRSPRYRSSRARFAPSADFGSYPAASRGIYGSPEAGDAGFGASALGSAYGADGQVPTYGGFPSLGQGVYGAPDSGVSASGPGAAYATAGAAPLSSGGGPYDKYRAAQQHAAAERAAAAGPYSGYNTSNAFLGPEGTFSPLQGVGAILPDFYRQGAFDPSGGGAYLEAIKRMLGAREQSDVAQAGLTSDLYGGDDPLARQYGRLKAEQGARNRYPEIIARAQSEAAARREAQIYELLQQRLGAAYTPKPRTDWGAVAGQVGGAALGGLLG